MKMKKLLAMVLCVAMVLSMMAFTVSAANTTLVPGSYDANWNLQKQLFPLCQVPLLRKVP